MIDYFATLGMPRRPWIDVGILKEHYHSLAAEFHPDRGGDAEQFKNVGEGYQTLQRPSLRLRHLMTLEAIPAGETARVGNSDLFLQAGLAIQSARAICEKWDSTQSAIARAALVGERKRILAQLRDVLATAKAGEEALAERLEALNETWPNQSPDELAAVASEWTFLDRWLEQLREQEFRLEQK